MRKIYALFFIALALFAGTAHAEDLILGVSESQAQDILDQAGQATTPEMLQDAGNLASEASDKALTVKVLGHLGAARAKMDALYADGRYGNKLEQAIDILDEAGRAMYGELPDDLKQ